MNTNSKVIKELFTQTAVSTSLSRREVKNVGSYDTIVRS